VCCRLPTPSLPSSSSSTGGLLQSQVRLFLSFIFLIFLVYWWIAPESGADLLLYLPHLLFSTHDFFLSVSTFSDFIFTSTFPFPIVFFKIPLRNFIFSDSPVFRIGISLFLHYTGLLFVIVHDSLIQTALQLESNMNVWFRFMCSQK
jgi:hypothetical protein